MIVFTEAMALAGKQIKQGMTLRVLHQLPGQLNFVDFRPLNQVALATELETGQGAISRAMAQLLDLGIVEKEGAGAHIKWRLSSNWGWNGNADQWHALRAGRLGKKKAPAPRTGTAESRIIHIM